ncbi:MAG: hypothetical protein IH899_17995 [Planctomycetes bacterium]|nr:hypothetical protein [Planctomycetota bacterium]
MNTNWFEVWTDDGLSVPYVLLVMSDAERQNFVVIDSKENNKVVFRSANYNTAKLWLLEDEYKLVEGRMNLE